MITCIIVEDEPLAADVLTDYINQIPFLKLAGTASDAIEALTLMHRENVDLVFLDIHLPGLKGVDFLRTLRQPPAVILTTAYHEYALQGYDLQVTDYLLKPIEFKRFVEAVNKVKPKSPTPFSGGILTINAEKKTIVLPLDDIIVIESQKEYIKVQTTTTSYQTKYALSKIEEELNPNFFLRVHRSFIINLKHVRGFNAQMVDVHGLTIPIGGLYKDRVDAKLKQWFG